MVRLTGTGGNDLFFREPPKSCARCKSKSWSDLIPQRKPRKNHVLSGIWVTNGELERMRIEFPWITNKARLRALARQNRDTIDNIFQLKPVEQS